MRKEIQFALVTALALQACAPVVAKDSGKGGGIEPQDKIFVPTETPIPPMPIPTYAGKMIEIPTATKTPEAKPWPFPYFSQHDYKGRYTLDNHSWDEVGCGMMVGGMITKGDPVSYYKGFIAYWFGQHLEESKVFNADGSAMVYHKKYLESQGYTFTDIASGKTVSEVKQKIAEITSNGGAVWMSTKIWWPGGHTWGGHHTMPTGIDSQGRIIANDPFYGQGVHLDDSRIQEQGWTVYEVEPPVSH